MADSPALRARRARLHAAGDHSLCSPGRCPALAAPPPRSGRRRLGGVESAVAARLANAGLRDDPRSALALRLAARIDEADDMGAARELRLTLDKLLPPRPVVPPPAERDELLERRRRRRRAAGFAR